MPEPIVFTDLDHTILGAGGRVGRAPLLIEELELAGSPVIPVTAKTIHEIVATNSILGIGKYQPLIAIAESGAAVYARPGVLPWSDGEVIVAGERLEYVLLYPSNIGLGEIDREARAVFVETGCGDRLVDVALLSPEELSRITGLPPELARLIPTRRHMKVYYMRDKRCGSKVKSILEEKGFYVGLGRNFLHVGKHRGKGWAVRWLLERVPLAYGRPSAGMGDSEPDREMLEVVDYAFVIPPERGAPLRLRRGDYVVAPMPPPEGWIWAAQRLLL